MTFPVATAADVRPNFFIRHIPVYGDLVLAPLDGYSDLPFRTLCRDFGSAMSYTEFVNVNEIKFARPNHGHAWNKLKFLPSERPVAYQIYGHEEDRLVEVALKLQDFGPDVIDINLGCSIRDIAERGAGAGLLRDPLKIGRIFAQLSRSLTLPFTAKIRLGWDDQTRNYRLVARILEENGVSLIAVHGRTKAQAFTGQADWDAIAEVKQTVKIPVLGNGDVHTVADIERLKAHTQCDGVMIGRAAIGHPWIFARRDREQVSLDERLAIVRQHLAWQIDFYGAPGLVLFRKQTVRYFMHLPHGKNLRVPLLSCTTPDEFEQLLQAWESQRAL
jgi:tRNA-dihydrouridine synthase B